MKRVTLEIQFENGTVELRQLEDGTYTVGRDSGDIVLKNAIVSTRHGELKVSEAAVIYTDQGSTNGTYTTDGQRLSAPLTMKEGAVLKIGDCKITLKSIHQPAAATALQSAVTPDDLAHARTTLGSPPVQMPDPAPAPAPAPAVAPAAAAPAAANPPVNAPSAAIVATPQTAGSSQGNDTGAEGTFSYTMDIGALINTPMKDPEWIVKCVIIGLFTLIPIAGAINLAGWLITCYRNIKDGSDELPPANFSYLSTGMPLFLAYLPALGAIIGANIVLGVIGFFLPFLFFLSPIVNLAASLYLMAAGPAILHFTIEHNMTWASIRVPELIAFAKANSEAYTSVVIAFLIASVVGGAGSIIVIASIVTIPFSVVMQANILAAMKFSNE